MTFLKMDIEPSSSITSSLAKCKIEKLYSAYLTISQQIPRAFSQIPFPSVWQHLVQVGESVASSSLTSANVPQLLLRVEVCMEEGIPVHSPYRTHRIPQPPAHKTQSRTDTLLARLPDERSIMTVMWKQQWQKWRTISLHRAVFPSLLHSDLRLCRSFVSCRVCS